MTLGKRTKEQQPPTAILQDNEATDQGHKAKRMRIEPFDAPAAETSLVRTPGVNQLRPQKMVSEIQKVTLHDAAFASEANRPPTVGSPHGANLSRKAHSQGGQPSPE